MKILALVVARLGSKRVPGKNLKMLGHKPLISWTLDVAKMSHKFCDILVSTDDPKIAELSMNSGALVPWLRPSNLSSDSIGLGDVALHALNWYEKEKGSIDGIVLLQPTSPFRTVETINKGINLFLANGKKTVLGVSPTHSHPHWTFRIVDKKLIPFASVSGLNLRSQDLEPAYLVNGCFYLTTPALLRGNKSFYAGEILPLIVHSCEESIDIDTEFDFKFAQFLVNNINK